MASGRLYSLDEVIADMSDLMTIPGPAEDDEDWSDDDFEGYIDDEDEHTNKTGEESPDGRSASVERDISMSGGPQQPDIGAECEIEEVGICTQIPEYAYSAGCTRPCENATPLHFFSMLLTDNILDNIVEQTNLYANQFISTHSLAPRSRVHGWSREPFTRQELQKFIALIIVMGLVNLPALEAHWVTTWPYSSQTCFKVCPCCKEMCRLITKYNNYISL